MAETGGTKLSTLYVEMDLDRSKFEKNQAQILYNSITTSLEIEKNYRKLGIKFDVIYQAMANGAINAYAHIANSAKASADEQFRAQSAMVAKINALNIEMANNPLYATLGVRSLAAINAQKAAIIESYNTINATVEKGSIDQINIEAAKNAKLIALDNELNAVAIANNAKRVENEAIAAAEVAALRQKANTENADYWMLKISRDRSMLALETEAYAENARRTSDAAIAPWNTLGLRSTAVIEAQKASVVSSYEEIKKKSDISSQDILNIERAKNTKLKELNNEMVGAHEMSMASMTRAVLRFYAAYYIASTAATAISSMFMSGIKAIDDFKISTIAVAAQIASMQGPDNVAEHYREALIYAGELNKKLMEVDANSFANYEQIQLMNRAMTNHGVILSANNEKQVEAFTAITNTIALLTTGQNKEKQASQEMDALMTGRIKAEDRVAKQVDSIIKQENIYKGGLKEVVALGQQHGDTLERLKPYLQGIIAATGDIATTWESVSSSLDTAWGIIKRNVFKDVYKSLVDNGRDITKWLKDNAEDIAKSIKSIVDGIKFAITAMIIFFGLVALIAGGTALWAAMGRTIIWVNLAIDAGIFKMVTWNALLSGPSVFAVTSFGAALTSAFWILSVGFMAFEFGTWLSDRFEFVRKAGVYMVYGIMGAWDWLIEKFKIGWEYMKSAEAIKSAPAWEREKMYLQSDARIKAIKAEYATEKARKSELYNEQLKAVTDAAIAEEKARAAIKAKVKDPKITPPPPPPEGASAKDAMRIERELLTTKVNAIKESYDTSISESNRWLSNERNNGENELSLIVMIWNKRDDAIKKSYSDERDAIEESKLRETEKAQLLSKLDKDYHKKLNDNTDDDQRNRINFANKHLDVMSNVYKTIDQYSKESLAADKDALKRKYKEEGAFIEKEGKKREAFKKSLNIDLLKQDLAYEIGAQNIRKEYLATISGVYTTEYKDAFERALQAEADLEKIKVGESFDRVAWLAAKRSEARIKELEEQATYYAAISGMEDKAMAASLAAIELRRIAEGKLKWDQTAADKKAAQDTMKIWATEQTKRIGNIKEGMSASSDAFEQLSQLYDKDSSERKKLHEIAMAFNVAEKAANMANAVVLAVEAIANQGKGEPYSAFPRIAAMAAVMAALLASAGIAFGGGSETAAPTLPESTVLGAKAGTGSESISNSYKLLEDTYSMEYRELSGIRAILKDLNQNITGLVTSIIRTGSVGNFSLASGSTPGIFETFGKAYMKTIFDILSFGIFGKIGGAIGSAIGSIFGGKTTTSATASGIQLGAVSVGNLLKGGGITGQQYADIKKETSGGWFRKDKTEYWTEYKALDQNVTSLFTTVFRGLGKTLVELSTQLGTDTQAALNYIFPNIKLNLQGMDSETINKTLTEYFSNVSDTAVETLFGPMLKGYQQLGEGLLETAVRIITDKAVILDTLKMTNQAYVGTVASTIAFSEALIALAGGLDKLTEAANTYYDKFFSDTDKQVRLQGQLYGALADQNMALPATRKGYKALVEAQNLNTEAGQRAYVTLLSLADAADKYYTGVKEAQQKLVEAQKGVVTELQGYVDKLKAARESMKMEGFAFAQQQTVTAQIAFNSVLEQARLGDLSGIKTVDKSLSTLIANANSPAAFATLHDYQSNFYRTYNSIAELESLAGTRLTTAEKTLNILQTQLDVLTNIDTNLVALVETQKGSPYRIGGGTDNVNRDKNVQTTFYEAGGEYSGGWRVVGERGPELEYTGPSKIYSNAQSKTLLDNTEVVNEIRKLREELNAVNYVIAKSTNKTAKALDRWDVDGLPGERTIT